MKLNGKIKHVICHKEEDNFCILSIITDKKEETVLGNCFTKPKEGLIIEAEGGYVKNKQYGQQFKADKIDIVIPTMDSDIEIYLSTILKGVGAKTAERMVKEFGGIRVFDIIKNDPKQLSIISGISAKKAIKIQESYLENIEFKNIAIFFLKFGLSNNLISKIYKEFGKSSIEIISRDPYKLSDLFGIGFRKADEISLSMGTKVDSYRRIQAAVFYILNQGIQFGQAFLFQEPLLSEVQKLINVEMVKIIEEFDNMLKNGYIIKYNDGIYLKHSFDAERYIASKLLEIENVKVRDIIDKTNLEDFIDYFENENNVKLTNEQKDCLYTMNSNKITIITGNGGVGKTFTIKLLFDFLKYHNLKTKLAAFTGKASDVLTNKVILTVNDDDETPEKAQTIHRLLEYNPSQGYTRNEENNIVANVIIIDEVSMLDYFLCRDLLKAVNSKTRIVLVGDIDQLPSIMPGDILNMMIQSEKFKVIRLTKTFRQNKGSDITEIANGVNKGKKPKFGDFSGDFWAINSEDSEKTIELMKRYLIKEIKENNLTQDDIQIITPMNKGNLGTNVLNKILQDIFNSKNKNNSIHFRGTDFRLGDKVMQLQNNYEDDVFNGNNGIIVKIDKEFDEITVLYGENNFVVYDRKRFDEITLSYACTVHKTQGSEFRQTIVLIHQMHYIMLKRKLLYTALTRGKERVVLFSNKKAIYIAVNNNDDGKRNSNLLHILNEISLNKNVEI